MYFKKLAEKLGEVPDYVIEYLNDHVLEIRTNAKHSAPRLIFGDRSRILSLRDSSPGLKEQIDFIQCYIMSQQYEILKDKIPYERSSIVPGATADISNVPNRYINRIGEFIAMPITGYCSIKCSEFDNVPERMKIGELWRYNTRVPLTYEYSHDFTAVIIAYIDYDLSHYLMPFDVHGLFPRRRDEWLDSTPEDFKNKEIDTNAY
jgi:hypothetical protein